MSREVSIENLMRFFDCDLSESERRTVARKVSRSKRLQDELVFLESVRSGFQDLRLRLKTSDGSVGTLPADGSREALNKTGVVSWYETTGEL